jgi:hypothetical protein
MKNILDKINRADEIQANLELDKTELAKHEVELGAAQDLEKELSNIKNLQNPLAQNIDRLTNLDASLKAEKKLANDNLLKLNASYEKAVQIHDKLKVSAKELGIDLPIVNSALNVLKGAEADFKEIKSLLNQIK